MREEGRNTTTLTPPGNSVLAPINRKDGCVGVMRGSDVLMVALVIAIILAGSFMTRATARYTISPPQLSKASINVRVGVQHKCHFVMAPLYQMFDAVRAGRERRPGGPSASMYFLMVALWIPNSLSIARSDIPLRMAF